VGFPDIIEAGMHVSAKADMRYSGFVAPKSLGKDVSS
jgi:hypothetical protein